MNVSDQELNDILAAALDALPEKRVRGLQNVLITYEDEPSAEQLLKQGVRYGVELLGLYEGIPLTKRNAAYNMVIPDRITVFKNPIIRVTGTMPAFIEQVRKTLWHEIAHYYGLDHKRIHELE
jgi:predicted Zn-dependent protease with MMP-like domain